MKTILQQVFRDRGFIIAGIASAIALLAVLVLCAVEIRPNELQIPIRNTVFGITYTYREQWYNQLVFVGFALIVALLHTAIAARLYVLKDRRYGIAFEWMTAALLAVTFLTLIAVFKVISVVQ